MKKLLLITLISAVGGSLIAQEGPDIAGLELDLHVLIENIYGNPFDEGAFNQFVQANKGHFAQGGFGDLDAMISRQAPNGAPPGLSWAYDLHGIVHSKENAALQNQEAIRARAFKVLKDLNDYRSNKLSDEDFKLLESPNSRANYCIDLVMNCLLSSDRHEELKDLLQNEQDLRDRGIVPDDFISIDALDKGIFVGDHPLVNVCPSLKIFPELNWVREKIAPHVDKITDANKASDDQEIGCVEYMIGNLERVLDPSVAERILINSGLDVDLVDIQGTSLGKIIDDSKDTADNDVQQDPNSADLQEKARRWTMIQLAAEDKRSKKASWVLPSDQDAHEKFIGKVFEYLEEGKANTLKNLQNYMIDYDRGLVAPGDYAIYYDEADDEPLRYVINRLIVRNSGELFDRADAVADLLGNKIDLQNNDLDADYGKEVTGELLCSLIQDPRYKTLATRYYDNYKVDISQVEYENTKLGAYLKAHADDDGCKRVNAILNPQTSPDPDKGSWSTNQKLAAAVLLAGVGYILYSQYTSSQDDADTTAVA